MADNPVGGPSSAIVLVGFTRLDEAAVRLAFDEAERDSVDHFGPCVVVRVTAATLHLVETARRESPNATLLVLDSGVGRAAAQVARRAEARVLEAGTPLSALVSAALGDPQGTDPEAAGGGPLAMLTAREIEVLRLLRAGASNDTISERLGISVRTARGHVHRVLVKLGVSDRVAAAQVARHAALPAWDGVGQ